MILWKLFRYQYQRSVAVILCSLSLSGVRSAEWDYSIQEGTPRNSVLICTCFMIAINIRYILNHIGSAQYVDDFTIYSSGNFLNSIERRFQLVISGLSRRSLDTGLSFYEMKAASIHICMWRNCPEIAPNLTLNERDVWCAEQHEYLGKYKLIWW